LRDMVAGAKLLRVRLVLADAVAALGAAKLLREVADVAEAKEEKVGVVLAVVALDGANDLRAAI
jgi:hypothetical protein